MEEQWLFEAISETYIPLLLNFKKLEEEHVDFRITMSMTPPLLSMLDNKLLQKRYIKYLETHIELCEKGQLIFATTFEKPFYQRLKGHPQISITALRGSETMNSVGFTLTGIANEVDQQYIDQIFASHPEMEQIRY